MRLLAFLWLLLSVLGLPCDAAGRQARPFTVLFVGNSLTYVGNTPAIFDALALANGAQVSSDFIVRGGATLTDRVADGSVARALTEKNYTAMVLQERGGDLICAFGPDSCVQSRQAIKTLTLLARKAGAKTFLLGTYQANPKSSQRLVDAESAAAVAVGIAYIEVSQKLQKLRDTASELTWFAPDGIHPGPALALLNAILLHQALLHVPAKPVAFATTAPIYGSVSGLDETLRMAEAPPPLASTPTGIHYSSDCLKKLLSVVGHGAGD